MGAFIDAVVVCCVLVIDDILVSKMVVVVEVGEDELVLDEESEIGAEVVTD